MAKGSSAKNIFPAIKVTSETAGEPHSRRFTATIPQYFFFIYFFFISPRRRDWRYRVCIRGTNKPYFLGTIEHSPKAQNSARFRETTREYNSPRVWVRDTCTRIGGRAVYTDFSSWLLNPVGVSPITLRRLIITRVSYFAYAKRDEQSLFRFRVYWLSRGKRSCWRPSIMQRYYAQSLVERCASLCVLFLWEELWGM